MKKEYISIKDKQVSITPFNKIDGILDINTDKSTVTKIATDFVESVSRHTLKVIINQSHSTDTKYFSQNSNTFLRKKYIEHNIENDRSSLYVYLLGYLKSSNDIIVSCNLHYNSSVDLHLLDAINSYKHIDKILFLLNENKQMSHHELADNLNLQPNTLSNLISRVSEFNLFNVTTIGRNKFYSLSNTNGKRAFKYLQDKNVTTDSFSSDLEHLIDSLYDMSKGKSTSDYLRQEIEKFCFLYTKNPNRLKYKLFELFDIVYKSSKKNHMTSQQYYPIPTIENRNENIIIYCMTE